MGENLRQLLEEGVRIAYRAPAELAQFASVHHVSPSLKRLLEELHRTFGSSTEALAWLERSTPAADSSPFDLIAKGEAYRVVRALATSSQ